MIKQCNSNDALICGCIMTALVKREMRQSYMAAASTPTNHVMRALLPPHARPHRIRQVLTAISSSFECCNGDGMRVKEQGMRMQKRKSLSSRIAQLPKLMAVHRMTKRS